MRHHFRPRAGQALYHYTSAETAKQIIKSNRFWLSEYSRTNDSSEYAYARDAYVKAYQNREVWIDNTPRYLATSVLIGSESNTVMFIGCLTQRRDDLSQWRAYGDNAAGCVLGIDAEFLYNQAGVAVRKVIYSDNEVKRFVNAGLSMLQSQYEENSDDMEELTELASCFITDLFSFKNPSFAAEREIRISRLLVVDGNTQYTLADVGAHDAKGLHLSPLPVKLRQGIFGETRYIELPLSNEAGGSAVRSIGLGARCHPEDEAEIREIISSNPFPLKVWRSQIPYRA